MCEVFLRVTVTVRTCPCYLKFNTPQGTPNLFNLFLTTDESGLFFVCLLLRACMTCNSFYIIGLFAYRHKSNRSLFLSLACHPHVLVKWNKLTMHRCENFIKYPYRLYIFLLWSIFTYIVYVSQALSILWKMNVYFAAIASAFQFNTPKIIENSQPRKHKL